MSNAYDSDLRSQSLAAAKVKNYFFLKRLFVNLCL